LTLDFKSYDFFKNKYFVGGEFEIPQWTLIEVTYRGPYRAACDNPIGEVTLR
jgi:hypothetical protein